MKLITCLHGLQDWDNSDLEIDYNGEVEKVTFPNYDLSREVHFALLGTATPTHAIDYRPGRAPPGYMEDQLSRYLEQLQQE